MSKKINKFSSLSKKYGTKNIIKLFDFITNSGNKKSTKVKDIRILEKYVSEQKEKGKFSGKKYTQHTEKISKQKDYLNESINKTTTLKKSLKEKYGYSSSDKKAIVNIIGDKARIKAIDTFDNLNNTKEINRYFMNPETHAQIITEIYQDGKKKTVSIGLDEQQWKFVQGNNDKTNVLNYLEEIHSKYCKDRYDKLKNYPDISISSIKSVRTDWEV